MLRRCRRFLLLTLCVLFLCRYYDLPSRSQSANHSLSLNGTTSYVQVPYNASHNLTGALTMEAWFKTTSTADQVIIERSNWLQGEYSYDLLINAGKPRMDIYVTPGNYAWLIGNTTVTTGVWHHLAGVYDGSQMRIYLDGVLDGSKASTTNPASTASGLRIGRTTNIYFPCTFNGLIDEVRLSNAAMYTSNFTPSAHLTAGANTRGLWKFDGQTANDFSSNGNNGTVQEGATYSTDVPTGPNNAPSVSLTDPQNNTVFAAGATVMIDAAAADSDGSIARVEFFNGTTLLGSDTSAPYSFSWPNVAAGSYALMAKATDDAGATTSSTAITVTVTQPETYHSLSLNGTTSYVQVPYNASHNLTGALTMEAWFKTTSTADQVIIERSNWWQAEYSYDLMINAGKPRMDIYVTPGSYAWLIGNTTVTTGVWHHLAGVYDGSQMRIYLDGVLDGSKASTTNPASTASGLRIGRTTNIYYPNTFNGLIDEVRLSNAAMYTSNFTPSAHLTAGANTRGLWKFDGQTANDFSSNGNNGTVQEGAIYSTDVPSQVTGSQRPVAITGGPYNGLVAQSVSFNGSGSFDPDGTITAYHWNFGDGSAANTASPSHSYPAPGTYTATLTVTDNGNLLASSTTTVTISGAANARLDPLNQTGGGGENPLSRNFNWNLPLVNLPGRAGMDLSIGLSYNSLVWTKTGSNTISFDDDRGWPSPGFRLGFPVIQPLYYNPEVSKYAFLLIGSDGSRTELRQVGPSLLYEAAVPRTCCSTPAQ